MYVWVWVVKICLVTGFEIIINLTLQNISWQNVLYLSQTGFNKCITRREVSLWKETSFILDRKLSINRVYITFDTIVYLFVVKDYRPILTSWWLNPKSTVYAISITDALIWNLITQKTPSYQAAVLEWWCFKNVALVLQPETSVEAQH